MLPIRSLGFTSTFGNELIFAVSVPRARARVSARASLTSALTGHPDTAGVGGVWTQSSACYQRPFCKYALGPAGSDPHQFPLPSTSLSTSQAAMHVRRSCCMCSLARERELLRYAYRSNSSVYVLCIPDDCAAEIRFFCLRHPHSLFLQGGPERTLISADVLHARNARDASRSLKDLRTTSPGRLWKFRKKKKK